MCRFAFGKFLKATVNYPSPHKEILPTKKAIEAYKIFFLGFLFIAWADLIHLPKYITSTNSEKTGNGCLLRWA